jgi:6-phosphofructokinase 2
MPDAVTLTVNPAIDVSTSVERVAPIQKLRCAPARRDPGGGGINVARVMKRLGADVMAVYPVGGAVGQLLRRLVDQEAIPGLTVPIAGETREDFTVLECATGEQYRFILPGPQLSEQDWRACLEALSSLNRRVRFVVASGSLPPGVPEDFYARVALAVKQAKVKVVVDTAGTPLKAALASGVYLVKPNLRELTELIGGRLSNEKDWIAACRSPTGDAQSQSARVGAADQAGERRGRPPHLPWRHDLDPSIRSRHRRCISLRHRRGLGGISALQLAISVIGVIVFVGLTAYDTQRIKEIYLESDTIATAGKKAIIGALTLYLDFINLFLMLLQLSGERRE